MRDLFKAVNEAWYEQYGTVNANIKEFCFDNGFCRWEDIIDDEGNVVDSLRVITRKDLQECCDAIGIDFDCMNY